MELRVVADAAAVAEEARAEVLGAAARAIAERGAFRIALAGGRTPRALYELLAEEDDAGWERWHVFFGDERMVPPDHEESNYRLAFQALLRRAPIARRRVHRVRTELGDAARAAQDYEAEIAQALALRDGERPRFDLVLLGLGPDAHTASLFPGSSALDETERDVCAAWVEKLGAWRVTLTVPAINAAHAVLFLVAGADKAEALRAVLGDEGDARALPARLIHPSDGTLLLIADRAAAGRA